MSLSLGRVLVLVGLAAAGCGSGSKSVKGSGLKPSTGGGPEGVPSVDATLCDAADKKVQSYDLNRDSKPDVWKLFKTTTEKGTAVQVQTCRQVDYDHDGRKDHVLTFDDNGTLLAEEFDFDYDGTFDARYHYGRGGGVTLIERDSDHDKKPDVWEKYGTQGVL